MIVRQMDVSSEETIVGIESLMYDHFKETSLNTDSSKLKPNWVKYKQIQDSGNLILFGAFQDEVLVGYVCLIIAEPLHYTGTLTAVSDTIYLIKELRNSRVGLDLMQAAKTEAKNRGSNEVHWYAKEGSALEALLKRKNCKVRDIVLTEEL